MFSSLVIKSSLNGDLVDYYYLVGGKKKNTNASASSIVNRTSKQFQITLSRIQAQGTSVQVWIDEVPFTQLLQWLDLLATQEGLSVINIDLSVADKSGVVQVRRLQLGKI